MENSNYNKNRHNEHLGVNKMGKNIRKSPLHQPNFGNPKPQPQPQVYNISKNDFRNIVQQLTGSPSQDPPPQPPLPPHNPPKPASMRLQKIRPPPLTPINRPRMPMPPSVPNFNAHPHAHAHAHVPTSTTINNNNNNSNNNNNHHPNSLYFSSRPTYQQPSLSPLPAFTPPPGDSIWSNTAESPISAYMRYLQNSIDSGSRHPQSQNQLYMSSSSGLLPTPPPGRANPPGLLPSPLPSPTPFLNLLSPRSPYPLLSPGFQYPLPTPNFSFSPLPRSPGILGPVPQPLPPSPGLMFPPSPSGLLPLSSPRWRDP
eukprot:TRINITY_DN9289_c0_g3_i1.p1 TRINITY_DN9289_c0_g3~~TRINITY_DN9289_c0_g3_i1.p1  ORF type:complete len:313 (-),score=10.64 TRINITY_DN9289_c0_g3_i1:560-1498(-)